MWFFRRRKKYRPTYDIELSDGGIGDIKTNPNAKPNKEQMDLYEKIFYEDMEMGALDDD